MKISSVKYSGSDVYPIERYCAAFLTDEGEVIIVDSTWDGRDNINWPFFNKGDVNRFVKDIMSGKKRSIRIAPIIGAIGWEVSNYNETLVDMAKTGRLVKAIIIEDIPQSVEILHHFAEKALKE